MELIFYFSNEIPLYFLQFSRMSIHQTKSLNIGPATNSNNTFLVKAINRRSNIQYHFVPILFPKNQLVFLGLYTSILFTTTFLPILSLNGLGWSECLPLILKLQLGQPNDILSIKMLFCPPSIL